MVEKFVNLYRSYTGHYRNSIKNCIENRTNHTTIGRIKITFNDDQTEVLSVKLLPKEELHELR